MKNLIRCLVVLGYAGVTLYTVFKHEPGRDETQFWLIARDLTIPQIIQEMPYQAHPATWYLILVPLAKLGLPYIWHGIIHWLVAVAIVCILLWRSPFSLFTSIFAAFSYYLFWQYSIEVRNYALGILLLFLLAMAYRSRFTNPIRYGILLFFLFNSNVLMFPAAGALLALWGVEAVKMRQCTARVIFSAAFVVLGGLLAMWQVGMFWAPADQPLKNDEVGFQISSILKALVGMFFTGAGPVELLAAPAVLILLALLFPLLTRVRALAFALVFLAGSLTVIGFRPINSCPRHYGVILMGVLFSLWVAHYEKDFFYGLKRMFDLSDFSIRNRTAMICLNLSFVASTGYGWFIHSLDWKYNYSGCTEMAKFIKDNGLEKLPVASQRYAHLISIAAYFPGKTFWYAGAGKAATFVHANMDHFLKAHPMPYDKALARMDEEYPASQQLLILLDAPLDPSTSSKYKLLHKVDSTVFASDERCYLYMRLPENDPPIRLFP